MNWYLLFFLQKNVQLQEVIHSCASLHQRLTQLGFTGKEFMLILLMSMALSGYWTFSLVSTFFATKDPDSQLTRSVGSNQNWGKETAHKIYRTTRHVNFIVSQL